MKKISILHPSFKRPELAKKCYDKWIKEADNVIEIEYILSLAETDPQLEKYKQIFRNSLAEIVVLHENGWVKQLNYAAASSTGNLLVCIGDDFSCPEHWDTDLLKSLDGKSDYIVKTQDGIQSWIMTLPLMDRKYYNRFRYIVHPEYMHMFGDTWLTHIADLLGRVVNIPMLFSHNHYTTGKMKRDDVNIANDKTWMQGENLYIKHVKGNFGLSPEQIVGKLNCHKEHITWLKQRGVIL